MRKFTVLIVAVLFAGCITAQEVNMLSKRGEPILPEAGEFGLGINANPIIGYVGNLFNGTTGNNATFSFINSAYPNNSIYLKYYLKDKVAIRGAFRFGVQSTIDNEDVVKNQVIMDPLVLVTDTYSHSATTLGIGADYLMYRGKGRVQGYFGGGAFVNYSFWKDTYKYGNAITSEFTSPTWYDFQNGMIVNGGERILSSSTRNNFAFTVRGLVGIEYFIAPKISLGGELGLGLSFDCVNNLKENTERWNGSAIEIEEVTVPNDYYIDFDNFASGSIFIMFHF